MLSVRREGLVIREFVNRNAAYLKSYGTFNMVLYGIVTAVPEPEGFRVTMPGGVKTFWNLYGTPIEIDNGVKVKLRDSAGMVSVLFQPGLLRKLLEQEIKDTARVNHFMACLADWQDRNDLKRLNGAESYDYRSAGFSYTPRNFYIQVPEEMMLIMGMEPDIYEKISDDIMYWGTADINFLTMSPRMLKIFLKDESLVERIVRMRKGGHLTLSQFMRMTGLRNTEGMVGHPSIWIKVEIESRVNQSADRIQAVIMNKQSIDEPFRIIKWKR